MRGWEGEKLGGQKRETARRGDGDTEGSLNPIQLNQPLQLNQLNQPNQLNKLNKLDKLYQGNDSGYQAGKLGNPEVEVPKAA